MYSTTHRLSTICGILIALNIIICVIFFFFLPNSELPFTAVIAVTGYLTTTTAMLLLIIIGLRSLCDALNFEFESNRLMFAELTDKIKHLQGNQK